jgi:ABC-type multidrug transport system fused ATPase/permease subunit
MLFNPLRQIAINKFNEMQLGMIAANRVFEILDTEITFKILELLTPNFKVL